MSQPHLNALYNGLYQHTNEHGVNSTKKRTETPKVTEEALPVPDAVEAMKYPKEPITFSMRMPL